MSNLLSMMYLVFNTTKGPTQHSKIRKALSLSIDQRILTEKVLRNGHEPAFSFVPELVSNYSSKEVPHKNLTELERLTETKNLLNDAGYNGGNPLKSPFTMQAEPKIKRLSSDHGDVEADRGCRESPAIRLKNTLWQTSSK